MPPGSSSSGARSRGEAAAEYRALAADLGGAGVPSVETALAERRLRPLHDAVAILVNDALVRDVTEALAAHLASGARAAAGASAAAERLPPPVRRGRACRHGRDPSASLVRRDPSAASPPALPDLDALVAAWEARGRPTPSGPIRSVAHPAVPDAEVDELARAVRAAPACRPRRGPRGTCDAATAAATAASAATADRPSRGAGPSRAAPSSRPPCRPTRRRGRALLGWLAAEAIGPILEPDPAALHSRGWFDRARLGRVFADAFRWRGLDEGAAWWTVETVRHLLARPGEAALSAPPAERAGRLVRAWFADDDLARWLGVNRHDGIAYVNRESFEAALRWMVVLVAVAPASADAAAAATGPARDAAHAVAVRLAADAAAAGYEVGRIVERATA